MKIYTLYNKDIKEKKAILFMSYGTSNYLYYLFSNHEMLYYKYMMGLRLGFRVL